MSFGILFLVFPWSWCRPKKEDWQKKRDRSHRRPGGGRKLPLVSSTRAQINCNTRWDLLCYLITTKSLLLTRVKVLLNVNQSTCSWTLISVWSSLYYNPISNDQQQNLRFLSCFPSRAVDWRKKTGRRRGTVFNEDLVAEDNFWWAP